MKIGKPLVVSVPKDTNFHIPEGKYRAKISSVKKVPMQKLNGTGEMLRILFEVLVPKLPRTVNLAKAESVPVQSPAPRAVIPFPPMPTRIPMPLTR